MKYVFLDFDGTVADSSFGIYTAFKKACKKNNLLAPSYEIFKKEIGPPIDKIIRIFFPEVNDKILDNFIMIFREDYDNYSYKITKLYENVEETLISMKSKFKLNYVVVTNKPTQVCKNIIKDKGLDYIIDKTFGIDYRKKIFKENFKTKAECIQFALDALKINSREAIYVGDTLSDKNNTYNVNMIFIASTYGFYNWKKENLPKYNVNSFDKLIKLIEYIIKQNN